MLTRGGGGTRPFVPGGGGMSRPLSHAMSQPLLFYMRVQLMTHHLPSAGPAVHVHLHPLKIRRSKRHLHRLALLSWSWPAGRGGAGGSTARRVVLYGGDHIPLEVEHMRRDLPHNMSLQVGSSLRHQQGQLKRLHLLSRVLQRAGAICTVWLCWYPGGGGVQAGKGGWGGGYCPRVLAKLMSLS
jgi:hypothetical protein